jgi:S-(hydroxymethyl)glutathione dehydrogenase / alcohol dehydrogenase
MKAAVLREIGRVEVEEIDDPAPRAGEVKLRMVATGVCGTDLSVARGHLPFPRPIVLGHEGAGIVVETGEGVRELAVGDPVVCTIVPSCGSCPSCLAGDTALCVETAIGTGRMLDGTTRLAKLGEPIHTLAYQSTFAEYAIVPERVAVRVRKDAPLERLCGLACGVSTGLGAALLRAEVEAGSSVLVIGAGGVGLSTLLGARLRGAALRIAVDVVPRKLEKALATGLATHAINASRAQRAEGERSPSDSSREPVVEAVRALTHGRGADHAFDAVGAPGTLEVALEATRPGGTCVVIGHARGVVLATIDTTRLLRQRWLTGTFGGSIVAKRDIPHFVDLFMAGQLDLDALLDAEYRLDDVAKALADLEAGRVTRPVLRF